MRTSLFIVLYVQRTSFSFTYGCEGGVRRMEGDEERFVVSMFLLDHRFFLTPVFLHGFTRIVTRVIMVKFLFLLSVS